MKIKTITSGMVQTNTYIVIDSQNKAVIIDPDGDLDGFIQYIEKNSLVLMAVLITHGHFDHIGAVEGILKRYGVPVITHEEEAKMMSNGHKNASFTFFNRHITAQATKTIEDGEILSFSDELTFECFVVAGHTSHSVCYYNKVGKFVITGDTLFAGSIGRVDFYLNDEELLIGNIKEKLLCLPSETIVYPGHGDESSIGVERRVNPFLY